jgi:hypothetical protein
MSEKTEFSGIYIRETEKARLLESGTGVQVWVPKSIFTYYRRVDGIATFSIESWKDRDLRDANFDEK